MAQSNHIKFGEYNILPVKKYIDKIYYLIVPQKEINVDFIHRDFDNVYYAAYYNYTTSQDNIKMPDLINKINIESIIKLTFNKHKDIIMKDIKKNIVYFSITGNNKIVDYDKLSSSFDVSSFVMERYITTIRDHEYKLLELSMNKLYMKQHCLDIDDENTRKLAISCDERFLTMYDYIEDLKIEIKSLKKIKCKSKNKVIKKIFQDTRSSHDIKIDTIFDDLFN
jgi:hypothetical protein